MLGSSATSVPCGWDEPGERRTQALLSLAMELAVHHYPQKARKRLGVGRSTNQVGLLMEQA